MHTQYSQFVKHQLAETKVKAVNRFGWGKAAVASLIIPGVLWAIFIGTMVFLIVSLGMVAGGLFSNTLQSLPK